MCAGESPVAWGHHGGEVCSMESAGPFLITIFTDPTPLRTGPVDISVLVQEGNSGQPLLDAIVTVRLQEQKPGKSPILVRATRQSSANKLLYSTLVDLSTPGWWGLQVNVEQQAVSAQAVCTVMVTPARSWIFSFWLYLTLFSVIFGAAGLRYRFGQHRKSLLLRQP